MLTLKERIHAESKPGSQVSTFPTFAQPIRYIIIQHKQQHNFIHFSKLFETMYVKYNIRNGITSYISDPL